MLDDILLQGAADCERMVRDSNSMDSAFNLDIEHPDQHNLDDLLAAIYKRDKEILEGEDDGGSGSS